MLGITIGIDRDLGLVGQSHRPFVVQAGMQAEVTAHAPARGLDFNVLISRAQGSYYR